MTTRLLYKYRGLEPWEHLLDVLIHKRLHTAKFHQLNDPMEGIFTYSPGAVTRQFVDRIIERKDTLRICALSKVHNSTLMWSYYASAHQGVVLGVEIDSVNAPGVTAIEDVKYMAMHKFNTRTDTDPIAEAQRILGRKLISWKHEQEVRVFAHSTYFPVAIRHVHLGCRMDPEMVRLLRPLIQKVLPDVEVRQMERRDLDRPVNTYGT